LIPPELCSKEAKEIHLRVDESMTGRRRGDGTSEKKFKVEEKGREDEERKG
jgi:hypothetical protein